MILSRTKKEDDYPQLEVEGRILQYMHYVTGMWYQAQQRDSLWEYALVQKALKQFCKNGNGNSRKKLKVADYGYCMGTLSPMLLWLGHDVTLVEIHQKGPEEENYLLEHLLRVASSRNHAAGQLSMWPKEPGFVLDEEKRFDAVFSTSTLGKVGNYREGFWDMCKLVKKGGMLFLTTSEEDRYPAARVFTKLAYEEMLKMAMLDGFTLIDGMSEWDWENQENSFVSMILVKGKE